ncbi:MAG TPA: lytic transglycosylase domain-containing protein, partial [Chloroflexaceae bacterium]|nr:lytic transglycosylase domain-containing protein [Chloroflexaceae bacterium]
LELGRRYPASDQGRAALDRAARAFFVAGRHLEAREAWQTLAEGNSGPTRARGAFWAGRAARAAGDEQAARELFAAARAAAPGSYEGARAAEELGGLPQGDLALGAPISPEQWAELESWVAAWAPEGAAEGVAERAARATRLEQVGLQAEAVAEWLEGAGVSQGPRANLALARAAHEAGAAYPALMAADALAKAAPPEAGPQPVALLRLLFPTPYPELVRREAAERGLDPRLLYALFRQESLFNPGATSWVGARGLGQVMPETGQGIAQNLGVADFALDDLYRPAVSIRFGAFYLGRRIADMEGSVHGALAAYNGGLGNAQRWAGGTDVPDPDAFAEVIDYPETRGYVRAVYGFWGVYQGLYAP